MENGSALLSTIVRVSLIYVVLAGGAEAGEKVRLWPDNLFGVAFPSADVGFVSGYGGTLLRTDNGGKTWTWSHVGVNELLRRLAFVDEQTGWAVGHRGSILHTSDSGKSWALQANQKNTYLRDIAFADDDHGWAVGHEATILRTTDGGSSWHSQNLTGFKGRDLPRLHAVSAIDRSRAMLAGEFGVVAYTEDGGSNWRVFNSGTKKTLLALQYLDNGVYLGAGLDGTLIRLKSAPPDDSQPPLAAEGPQGTANKAAESTIPPPFVAESIDAHTTEHFLAVGVVGDGRAVAAGRSVLRLVDDAEATPIEVDDSLQLPFTWFGGVDVASDGQFWLVGIRGTIASGSIRNNEKARLRAALGRSEIIEFGNDTRTSTSELP